MRIPKEIPSIISVQLESLKRDFESIKGNQDQLPTWFKNQVLSDSYPQCPRILLHEQIFLCLLTLSNQKVLNTIYQDQNMLIALIPELTELVDIAYLLLRFSRRRYPHNQTLYAPIPSSQTSQQTSVRNLQLLQKLQKEFLPSDLKVQLRYERRLEETIISRWKALVKVIDEHKLFRTKNLIHFLQKKNLQPLVKAEGDPFQKLMDELEHRLLFLFLFRPFSSGYSQPECYEASIHFLVYFLMSITSEGPQDEKLLINISNVLSKCRNQNQIFSIVKTLFSFLEVRYLTNQSYTRLSIQMAGMTQQTEDTYAVTNLVPLLNNNSIKFSITKEMCESWLTCSLSEGNLQAQKIEMLFKNIYKLGCLEIGLYIYRYISDSLFLMNQFTILFHVFQHFIRKKLIRYMPTRETISSFVEIIYYYALGFINRDRFDSEGELDVFTENVRKILFLSNYPYKESQVSSRLINLYSVYEYKFRCLSSSSKQFLEDLKLVNRQSPTIPDIYKIIENNYFKNAGVGAEFTDEYSSQMLKRSERYNGLRNLGCTCYMNSYLQALFMTKRIRERALKIRENVSSGSKLNLNFALVSLFEQLSDLKLSSEMEVNPELFRLEVPEPFRSSNQQQDSAEFGRMLIDSLLSELNASDDNAKSINSQFREFLYHHINRKIICKDCRNTRLVQEIIYDFLLPVKDLSQSKSLSISKLLTDYFLAEELSIQNQLYCDRCTQKTRVISEKIPLSFARYLICTIGLFKFGVAGTGEKILEKVEIEFQINLKSIKEDLPDANYQLYAFIVHLGDRIDRGHYVCYARNLDENPVLWYCFNDGYVTEQEILKTQDFKFGPEQTPYILFYSSSGKDRATVS